MPFRVMVIRTAMYDYHFLYQDWLGHFCFELLQDWSDLLHAPVLCAFGLR